MVGDCQEQKNRYVGFGPIPRGISHFSTFARAFRGKAFANKSAHFIGNYSGLMSEILNISTYGGLVYL
jgi:hypothetical protein